MTDDLEQFWSMMLGRDPEKMRELWETLTAEERASVYRHLQRMVTEDGWLEAQRISAQAALDALADLADQPGEGE